MKKIFLYSIVTVFLCLAVYSNANESEEAEEVTLTAKSIAGGYYTPSYKRGWFLLDVFEVPAAGVAGLLGAGQWAAKFDKDKRSCLTDVEPYEEYKICKYLQPDEKRASFSFSGSTEGDVRSDGNGTTGNNNAETYRYDASTFVGRLTPRLSFFRKTVAYESSGDFYTQLNQYNRENLALESKYTSTYIDVSTVVSGKKFFGDVFISGSGGYWGNYGQSEYNLELNRERYSHDTKFSSGLGYGRVDSVAAMAEAMQMMEELSYAGLLHRTATTSEIEALADIISVKRNEDFFDTRWQNMAAADEITQFLIDSGLVGGNEKLTAIIVFDDYASFSQHERYKGFRAEIGLFYESHYYEDYYNDVGDFRWEYYIKGGMTYWCPINRKLQIGTFFDVDVYPWEVYVDDFYSSLKTKKRTDFSLGTQWVYFLNSRWSVNVEETLSFDFGEYYSSYRSSTTGAYFKTEDSTEFEMSNLLALNISCDYGSNMRTSFRIGWEKRLSDSDHMNYTDNEWSRRFRKASYVTFGLTFDYRVF